MIAHNYGVFVQALDIKNPIQIICIVYFVKHLYESLGKSDSFTLIYLKLYDKIKQLGLFSSEIAETLCTFEYTGNDKALIDIATDALLYSMLNNIYHCQIVYKLSSSIYENLHVNPENIMVDNPTDPLDRTKKRIAFIYGCASSFDRNVNVLDNDYRRLYGYIDDLEDQDLELLLSAALYFHSMAYKHGESIAYVYAYNTAYKALTIEKRFSDKIRDGFFGSCRHHLLLCLDPSSELYQSIVGQQQMINMPPQNFSLTWSDPKNYNYRIADVFDDAIRELYDNNSPDKAFDFNSASLARRYSLKAFLEKYGKWPPSWQEQLVSGLLLNGLIVMGQ